VYRQAQQAVRQIAAIHNGIQSNTETTEFGQIATGNKQPDDYDYKYHNNTRQGNILPPAKKALNTAYITCLK
jgi:hypothetical protein